MKDDGLGVPRAIKNILTFYLIVVLVVLLVVVAT